MKNVKIWLIVTALMISFPLVAQSQEKVSFKLNTIKTEATQKEKSTNGEKIFFDLHEELFDLSEFRKGARIELETGGGNTTKLVLLKKTEYMPGTVSIIAAEEGNRENVFTATYSNGRLNGLLHLSHESNLFFSHDLEKSRNYLSAQAPDGEVPLSCGVHDNDVSFAAFPEPKQTHQITQSQKKTTSNSGYSPAPSYASVDDSITIDLMIVYTNAAEEWALTSEQGNINGVISQAMNLSQAALINSGLSIELRLVHVYKTDYDEENDGLEEESGERLRRLTQNKTSPVFDGKYDGYMEEVHDLRAEYGADVVSMIAKIDDTGGIGWRLGSTSGSPSYAFNLNRVQQVASNFTLIHEIGHNMGNAHSRTQRESAALGSGGLFQYSAGYQNKTANFHTIMAYADGHQSAPIFSSPSLKHAGVFAGTSDSENPEDNARSMREIKRTVASYHSTKINSPVAAVSTNSIEVEMNREDELFVPLSIFNSGESGLMWDVDFDFPASTVGKQKVNDSRDRIEPADIHQLKRYPANYSGRNTRGKSSAATEILYTTSFEEGEGFSTGSFSGIKEWKALTESEFEISTENPNSGSRHLRKEHSASDTTIQFVSAPFFGYQLFGKYEVSFDFNISSTAERFDIYFYDGRSGGFTGGVVISAGRIYAADLDENNSLTFFSTTSIVGPGSYGKLRILFNPEEEVIEYYYRGLQIAKNSYIEGKTPSEMLLLHFNQQSGAKIDIDNIEVKQLETPYSWLSIDNMSGVTFEESSSEVGLNFNTRGVSSGTYQTILTLTTNDPANRSFKVPITLEVNNTVSTEPSDVPPKISLDQNYPNPFNPTTTINYILEKAGNVELDVFNIQGQKVAALINKRQEAGSHQLKFDGSNLSSGIYIYRLKTASHIITRQMVLIK